VPASDSAEEEASSADGMVRVQRCTGTAG
jgi:hypothetical protein